MTSYLRRHHHKRDQSESTSLVSSRLRSDAHGVYSREFFDYDQAIGCTLHIADDGSGVNETDLASVRKRLVTRHRNKTGLFAGLPLETSTYGWDRTTGQEKLIGKVEHEYDSHGFISEERHYDSENVFRYLIQKRRDIQGNILSETNALGEVITRTFNKYGCLLREQSPCQEFFTEFCYDLLQRPIKKVITYSDGLILTTRTTYNLDNLPLKEEGIYGESTHTTYNAQKLPETVITPPFRLDYGVWISPKTAFTYDTFGHLSTETDLQALQLIINTLRKGKYYLFNIPMAH